MYTEEKNILIIIALLKAHGIKRIVISPGASNVAFVASVQSDPYFELYSCVDERSAAYIACGMAAESSEPVVLSCTGATASRNYMPGLTEAYYRKLPVLAITANRGNHKIGNLIPQQLDRTVLPNDIYVAHAVANFVKDEEDAHTCMLEINKAILALSHHGGGPVHIDMMTNCSWKYSKKELPPVQKISRITSIHNKPELPSGKIVIMIGAHPIFSRECCVEIERFVEANNAVVLRDLTSNYWGNYRIQSALLLGQNGYSGNLTSCDLLIHIGEISGDYFTTKISPKEVWRISEDGEIRDTFGHLSHIFEMEEITFFRAYSNASKKDISFYQACMDEYSKVQKDIPDLPFSNLWVANKIAPVLPKNSIVHLGILNSLRSWNMASPDPSTTSFYSNVGGFGIDGGVSSLIGASLIHPEKLYFGVFGDLAFFYDLNSLCNRHISSNIRILVINNGRGQEFRNPNHQAQLILKEDADPFVAAAGHNGNKSHQLVRHYAEDLGFRYLSANTKNEFEESLPIFIAEHDNKPIVFEVFTETEDESRALAEIIDIIPEKTGINKRKINEAIHSVISTEKIQAIKTLLS